MFFSCIAFADSETLYFSSSIQVRLIDKFRHEVVSVWPNCIERKVAEKTYLHDKNELREIAIWDKDGNVRGAAGYKNPILTKEIDVLFAKANKGLNPCLKSIAKPIEEKKEIERPLEEDKPAFSPGYLQ